MNFFDPEDEAVMELMTQWVKKYGMTKAYKIAEIAISMANPAREKYGESEEVLLAIEFLYAVIQSARAHVTSSGKNA